MMVIVGYERVYEIGTVFITEKHNSNRHLSKYVSLDKEIAFHYETGKINDSVAMQRCRLF